MTTTAPTEDARLKAKERETRKKYRHVVPGTIRAETEGAHAGKITVEIKCGSRGCKNVRRVATSDLFQVKRCAECAALAKKAARAANGKARASKKTVAKEEQNDDQGE
jgi:hypothetical protein